MAARAIGSDAGSTADMHGGVDSDADMAVVAFMLEML